MFDATLVTATLVTAHSEKESAALVFAFAYSAARPHGGRLLSIAVALLGVGVVTVLAGNLQGPLFIPVGCPTEC